MLLLLLLNKKQVAFADGVAKITINRPGVRNAFRPTTIREMRRALALAQDDTRVVREAKMWMPGLCVAHAWRAGVWTRAW